MKKNRFSLSLIFMSGVAFSALAAAAEKPDEKPAANAPATDAPAPNSTDSSAAPSSDSSAAPAPVSSDKAVEPAPAVPASAAPADSNSAHTPPPDGTAAGTTQEPVAAPQDTAAPASDAQQAQPVEPKAATIAPTAEVPTPPVRKSRRKKKGVVAAEPAPAAAAPSADVPADPAMLNIPSASEDMSVIRKSSASAGADEGVPGNPDAVTVEKVSVDDAGNRLLVLVQTSKPVECFVFERRDPPSLYVQFVGTQVYAGGEPIQVVGIDPLSEIRYGYATFNDASEANRDSSKKYPLEYIELKLNRPVFYHVQQEGWVVVVGLDRTTSKVEIPDLSFRFDQAKYEGASNLPPNPRDEDFVAVAQANSRLLAVSRDEADLAKFRVVEAQRALFPSATVRASETNGSEVNPFPSENFAGFEATSFLKKEYGVQLNQPLWQSGRLYGAFKQAKLNRLMAVENVRKQAQDLTFEMKKAYTSLLKYQTILRIRRELVAQGEVLKDMVKKKHKLDLTSKSEVLNVAAQADQAQYQLTSDEQDVALARLVVISLLNQSEPVPDPVPGALSFARLSFNVESIIGWAQEHRPDVRIATLNAELAKYAMKAANADKDIKVDASGFFGRAGSAFTSDAFSMQNAWNFGLKASRGFYGNTVRGNYSKEHTAPDLGQSFITETQQKSVEVGLMDSFAAVSGARQAELQYDRAKAELVEASRKAEFEVRQTYYNLEKAARQLEAVREDLKYRQKDLEITREKVKLGLAELSQAMAAEVAYAAAQITEQEALSAYNIALAEMDRVAGAEVVKS